ncbi:MAG TPA: kelch repeat-containing protein [Roseiflexaceae bacterium]|nr:kelch repeat-containing protein [Roseiflexaceae bacterium]
MSIETPISEREREILRLVATGATNQQIAAQLNISANTVKVHLRNIFTKIGVASRTEATIYAMRSGIIEPVGGVAVPVAPFTEEESFDDDPPTASAAPVVAAAPALPARRTLLVGAAILIGLLVIALVVLLLRTPPAEQPPANGGTAPGVVLPLPEQRWRSLEPLPSGRSGFAMVAFSVDDQRSLYLIGGTIGTSVTGEVLRFDMLANLWEPQPAKPLPVSDIQAAIVGDRIYVPGGRMADGSISDQVEAYDPRRNEWLRLSPLPAPRSGYALATLEGKIYLFGGWDGSNYQATGWQYNPDTDSWLEVSPMPTARAFAAAVSDESRIYVVGGENETGSLTANERYAPAEEPNPTAWAVRAPLPEARSRIAATSAGGLLFALGGDSSSRESLVYNLNLDQWQPLRTPLAAPLRDLRAQAIDGRMLYIVGGRDENDSTQIYEYQAIFTVFLPASDSGR